MEIFPENKRLFHGKESNGIETTIKIETFRMKFSTSAHQIYKGLLLHHVFKRFLLHTTGIEFEQTPDYDDWGNQFRNLFFEK